MTVDRSTCVNPFCDGYGNVDVSPSINGRAWLLGRCGVGPHPPQPADYRFPQPRIASVTR